MEEIFANAQILDVRIKNKVDSYQAWLGSDIVLGDGELAIARIQIGDGQLTPPAVALKVGNGVDLFKDLPWTQASAGDVHGWAKKEHLEYADFTQELREALKGDMTSDTNTTYTFTYENDTLVVMAKEMGENTVPYEVARLTIDVSTKINKVSGAVAGNIAAMTADGQVTDSGVAASAVAIAADVANTYETKAHAESEIARVEGIASGIDTRLGTAEGKITNLEAADVTLQSNIDAKVAKVTGAASGNVVAFAAGGEVADSGVAVSALAKAADVAATYETIANVESKVSAAKAELEGKLTPVSEKANANATAITALQGKDTELETAINTKVSKVTGAVDNVVVFAAEGAIKDTGVAIASLATKAEVKVNTDAIAAVAEDVAALEGELTKTNDNVSANAEAIGLLEDAVEVLNGEGTGSVKAAIDAAFNQFVTDVTNDEVVNTYKELIDYARDNADAVAGIVGDINSIKNDRLVPLENKAHEHGNKTVLDGITGDQVTAWDAAVQSISGVEATKTGTNVEVTAVSTDLLKNGSKTLVFNCGTASTVK